MRADDRATKRSRVRAMLRTQRGADALILTSHEALSWYLDGVRTHISLAGPPVLAVRVSAAGDEIFIPRNEADRLIAEELDSSDADSVVRIGWDESPAMVAAERGGVPESEIAAELRAVRAPLLDGERQRFRALGRECAEVMTSVAENLAAETTEREAASRLAGELVARGIDPLVILVSGSARLGHRHPLPHEGVLGERAMLVACGRRHGLIANLTRWVGEPGADDERILAVEHAFLSASVPGARVDEAFAAGTAGYASAGFPPDEWHHHHQGGVAGYAGRDPRAVPAGVPDVLADGQAVAWNPSAPGAKVEDTILVTADGWEILTQDPTWPAMEYRGLLRPLARPYSGSSVRARRPRATDSLRWIS